MKQGKLKVVPKPSAKPLDMGPDIHAQARAEIMARDWNRVHVEAEHREPLFFYSPPHKRGWIR
jgi:hypothetical protein